MKKNVRASGRRSEIREQFWPGEEDVWTGEAEKGWFRAPRTLPLVLSLLSTNKAISGEKDPSMVYLDLIARHIGEGVVEMVDEREHAFAAGYEGTRAVRTWQERIKILERNGFIKTAKVGNRPYKYALIVHPTVVIQRLHKDKKVSTNWWNAYKMRKAETREPTFEQREKKKTASMSDKVVSFKQAKGGKKEKK